MNKKIVGTIIGITTTVGIGIAAYIKGRKIEDENCIDDENFVADENETTEE